MATRDARRRKATVHPPMAFELTSDRKAILDELLPRYPTKQALTIPLLHICQEQAGHISDEVIEYVAKKLSLSTADVKGVVTFYTLFQQKPVGRNVVWVSRPRLGRRGRSSSGSHP